MKKNRDFGYSPKILIKFKHIVRLKSEKIKKIVTIKPDIDCYNDDDCRGQ